MRAGLAWRRRAKSIGYPRPQFHKESIARASGISHKDKALAETAALLVLSKKLCGRILVRFGLDPVRDVQVLCPTNRGGLGALTLNIELQEAPNPAGAVRVERFGGTMRRRSCRR
jgi:ATP-dependent exoDNAse (exonuclease V) alpha subunit